MPNIKKPRSNCLMCGKETPRPGYKYCSNLCQHNFQHKIYISKWIEGKVHGLQSIGVVSIHVKNYLRDKFKNKTNLGTQIIPDKLRSPDIAGEAGGPQIITPLGDDIIQRIVKAKPFVAVKKEVISKTNHIVDIHIGFSPSICLVV